VLTYFDFFTAAPPLAGLALKAAKAKRVELDVAAIEGAPLHILAGPHRALEVFSSVGRLQQAQVSEACWAFWWRPGWWHPSCGLAGRGLCAGSRRCA
jgi:hypothetical protein